jgi:hypothetical protein
MGPVVCVVVGAVLAAAGADDGWQTVPVFDDPGLTVRVKVKKQAKASDAGWLVLEFVNGGKEPMTVTNAHYRIGAEFFNLQTDQRGGSGGLASGNTFDLFPEAWKTTPVAPIVLKPGEPYRAVDQPSNYSTALLGVSSGLRVRAALHMRLEVKDGRVWETPPKGVAFAFDWLPPDADDVAVMRRRLKAMMAEPSRYVHQVYLLGAYLNFPDAADGVTCDELLAALGRRPEGSAVQGRETIARHLGQRFAAEAAVRDYYLGALKGGDRAAISDLMQVPGLWHKSFVGPLADLFTADPQTYHAALPVLHQHRADWAADQALARKLSAAVRGQQPLLRQKVSELMPGRLMYWAMAVGKLALTGDKGAVADLKPALDDTRNYAKLEHMAFIPGMRSPPTRVCDAALDAILTILDGGPDDAYRKAGLIGVRDSAAAAKIRDEMIAELKKRLSER